MGDFCKMANSSESDCGAFTESLKTNMNGWLPGGECSVSGELIPQTAGYYWYLGEDSGFTAPHAMILPFGSYVKLYSIIAYGRSLRCVQDE
jgi:hypothetical protein